MRLLFLLWAMLASLGGAASGVAAAASPVEASVSVSEVTAPVAARRAPPSAAATGSADPARHRALLSVSVRPHAPLYADRRRE
jgi:hypothetical protein